ncbi:MAG: aminotransferase class IV [Culicoidibacterales bacterium]
MIYDWQKRTFLQSDGQFLLDAGGYFETIKIENTQLVYEHLHIQRITYALEMEGYSLPCFEMILDDAKLLLTEHDMKEFNVLKLVYFPNENNVYFQFRTFEQSIADYTQGVRIQVFSLPRKPLKEHGYKITNRSHLNQIREQGKRQGYFEVVFQNENKMLLEGTVSNIFFMKAGKIYTPMRQGILAGIMRNRIIQRFQSIIEEKNIPTAEIGEYDGCFITNALIGIMPVCSIECDDNIYMYDITHAQKLQRQMNEKDGTK